MKESEGFSIRWNGRILAIAGSLLVALTSFTSFQVSHLIAGSTETQRQNDRLDDVERRVGVMEISVKLSAESQIRTEEQLKEFTRQHEFMMEELKAIRQTVDQHERESRLRKQALQRLQSIPYIEDEQLIPAPGLKSFTKDLGLGAPDPISR